MQTPFRLGRRQLYPWWFLASAIVVVSGFYMLPKSVQSPELLLSFIGCIAAFFHFLYVQHSANTDRFSVLFRDFNSRFDLLNDDLNRIRAAELDKVVDARDIQILFDYFNLCGEEYLYFKAGYIDQEVWESWVKGMSHFARNEAILELWQYEIKQGSYYGFELKLLLTAK